MATRHQRAVAAPPPANRGAVVPTGKQKAAAAVGRPDARHRKALGDIGNVVNSQVVDGKIQLPEGINRPITRSFCSQLLQKAQADAVAANKHESRPTDYMASQLEINPNMRAILTDWIVEVHYKFELMPETLYLTMYVIDRYLSMQPVLRRELQLVGVAAMLISCKYEEIWAPEVNDFICIFDNAYTRQQILSMEKSILNKLEWNLTVPTPYVFLVRFVKAAGSDKELEHMVFFFAEMALKEYSMVSFCPSMVAASAVYAARCTLKKSPLWTDTLKHHTGFNKAQLLECAKILVNSHAAAPEGKLKAVYKKYLSEQLGRVALHPPAVVQGLI